LIGLDSNGAATHAVGAEAEPIPTKRPRGRPRKYPRPVSIAENLQSH